MRMVYFCLTIPFLIVAKLLKVHKNSKFNKDLENINSLIAKTKLDLDNEILHILLVAEDHRVNSHLGIDHYAMLRAIYYTKFKKEFQGASTISQQLARVVTGRYERTWLRKLREQLLAVSISRKFSTEQISTAYLKIAFLGSGMNGLNSYLKWKKLTYELSTLEKVEIIARLKYPEPLTKNNKWSLKMKIRISNILSKLEKSLPTSL
ncbi:hypothetical protein G9F31_11870 [Acinetobacter sp. 187]|uniref:transglycosylase domain-containing protein n=1 Tax=Acinetobacter lanii TaxID=2715163 RepID=UPI00140CE165|nr:transglycosylase domain-containing protein [Acinetobacter lanii]NHC04454.1 hypothetical protein [Acinetobacter lanii]